MIASIRSTTVNANTSTGTQDITISGVSETPKAAIFLVTLATTDDGSLFDGRVWSVAFTDGTTEKGVVLQSEDNVSTMDTSRTGQSISAVLITDDAGSLDGRADMDSFISGGVRIDWINAPSVAYEISVVMFFGDDIEVAVGSEVPPAIGAGTTAVNVGFKPDMLFTLSGYMDFNAIPSNLLVGNFALTVRTPGDGSESRGISWIAETGASTSENGGMRYRNLGQSARPATNIFPSTELDSWTSTGFEISSDIGDFGDTGSGPRIGYLAIRFPDNAVALAHYNTDATTGTEAFTGVGFKPQAFLGLFQVDNYGWPDSAVTYNNDMGGGGLLFANDRGEETCIGHTEQEAQSTSNNSSFLDGSQSFNFTNHRKVKVFEADVDSWDSDGFTLNKTTDAASGHTFAVLLLEQDTYSGTGSGNLPLLTGSGSGDLTFSGSGSGNLPLLQGSASGQQVFSGTADGSLPLLQSAAAGSLVFSGTATGDLPLLLGTAAGSLTFTATATAVLPLLQGTASGLLAFSASGAGTLPLLSGTSSGLLAFSASGAGTLPLLSGTSSGLLAFSATAAGALPLLIASASGAVDSDVTGSGAGVLPLLTATASGAVETTVIEGEVELAASFDSAVSFSAGSAAAVSLSASFDSKVSSEASFDVVASFEASYDAAASFEAGVD